MGQESMRIRDLWNTIENAQAGDPRKDSATRGEINDSMRSRQARYIEASNDQSLSEANRQFNEGMAVAVNTFLEQMQDERRRDDLTVNDEGIDLQEPQNASSSQSSSSSDSSDEGINLQESQNAASPDEGIDLQESPDTSSSDEDDDNNSSGGDNNGSASGAGVGENSASPDLGSSEGPPAPEGGTNSRTKEYLALALCAIVEAIAEYFSSGMF